MSAGLVSYVSGSDCILPAEQEKRRGTAKQHNITQHYITQMQIHQTRLQGNQLIYIYSPGGMWFCNVFAFLPDPCAFFVLIFDVTMCSGLEGDFVFLLQSINP